MCYKLKRKYLISFFLFLALILVICSNIQQVIAEPDESLTVELNIQVFNIDIQEKLANITIQVQIPNFPYNETSVLIRIVGGGDVTLQCKNVEKNNICWFFKGDTNQTLWLLDGSGEAFPFDTYTLRFKVEELSYFTGTISLSSNIQDAYFSGQLAYKLKDNWHSNDLSLPLRYVNGNEVGFVIEKNLDSTIIIAIQFLAPIVACYYLLGATRFLDPRKNLAGRLRIHLSLFVFSSTFLLTIQPSLPYHSSLTFPEFLLTNLTISTAIFGIFSLIGNKPKKPWEIKEETKVYLKHDSIGSLISMAIFLVLYVVIMVGKMNTQLSLFLTFIIIPSLGYAYNLNAPQKEIQKHKNYLIKLLILSFVGYLVILLISVVITRFF